MIERANNVKYGLSACVWSENSGRTHRVAQALDVCEKNYMLQYIYVHVCRVDPFMEDTSGTASLVRWLVGQLA